MEKRKEIKKEDRTEKERREGGREGRKEKKCQPCICLPTYRQTKL